MKTLLTEIQTRLNDEVTEEAGLPTRSGNLSAIWIVPDENDIPPETAFPCIGIKDGGATYTPLGSVRQETLSVTIIGYVNLPAPEESMIGSASETGVLDLMAEIKTALDGWLPTGFYSADLLSETASVRLIKMDPSVSQEQWPMLQKKTATFRYMRETQYTQDQ